MDFVSAIYVVGEVVIEEFFATLNVSICPHFKCIYCFTFFKFNLVFNITIFVLNTVVYHIKHRSQDILNSIISNIPMTCSTNQFCLQELLQCILLQFWNFLSNFCIKFIDGFKILLDIITKLRSFDNIKLFF